MRLIRSSIVVLPFGMLVLAGCTVARDRVDRDLAGYIDTLRAVDAHAHPLAFTAAGAAADTDFDALPLDGLPPFALPLGLRSENPAFRAAQRALYGVVRSDTGSAYRDAVAHARAMVMQRRDEQFPAWALDQSGIDIMLSNRVAMGRGLAPPRFRWVAFADALLLPLDVGVEAARTPDTRALYPLEAKLLRRYLKDLAIAKLPATLDRYQQDVVAGTLARQRSGGAVAIKFEAAYLRSLDFEPADSAAAVAIYSRYVNGGTPTHAEYTLLEDWLFRVVAREAGRLGLVVQIHSTDGFGGFYAASGAAPHLLESVLGDSTLRGTRFVIVHGGWPLVDETLELLSRPNAYADISMMDLIAEPRALASTLRTWLAAWPEKVMFGTDAFDGGDTQGWEQVAWVASRNARRALIDALGGMVRDSELTIPRARQLARMVMRENAMAVYRLAAR